MKNSLIILIFSIFFFSCKKENAAHFRKNGVIDSLLVVANTTKDDQSKLKIADKVFLELENNKLDSISRKKYLTISRIYFSLNNTKYVDVCKRIISNPSNPVNHYEISYYNFLLGIYNYNKANYEAAFIFLSKAEKSFKLLKDLDYLSFTLNTKADILTFKKDFVGAEALSVKALKIAKRKKTII